MHLCSAKCTSPVTMSEPPTGVTASSLKGSGFAPCISDHSEVCAGVVPPSVTVPPRMAISTSRLSLACGKDTVTLEMAESESSRQLSPRSSFTSTSPEISTLLMPGTSMSAPYVGVPSAVSAVSGAIFASCTAYSFVTREIGMTGVLPGAGVRPLRQRWGVGYGVRDGRHRAPRQLGGRARVLRHDQPVHGPPRPARLAVLQVDHHSAMRDRDVLTDQSHQRARPGRPVGAELRQGLAPRQLHERDRHPGITSSRRSSPS